MHRWLVDWIDIHTLFMSWINNFYDPLDCFLVIKLSSKEKQLSNVYDPLDDAILVSGSSGSYMLRESFNGDLWLALSISWWIIMEIMLLPLNYSIWLLSLYDVLFSPYSTLIAISIHHWFITWSYLRYWLARTGTCGSIWIWGAPLRAPAWRGG